VDSSLLKKELVTSDALSIDTLEANTDYHWYVRAYCGEGDSSAWAGPHTFYTACGIPSNLTADSITDTSADIIWTETGIASQWQVRIDTIGFDTTGIAPVTVSNDTVRIDTLFASGAYDFYVRAYCGTGDSSAWAGPYTFSTKLCDPFTAPFEENFGGITIPDLPECWRTLITDPTSSIATVDSLTWSDTVAIAMFGKQDLQRNIILIAPEISDLQDQDKRIRFMARIYADNCDLIVGTLTNPEDTTTFSGYDTLQIVPVYKEYIVSFDTNYKLNDHFIAFKHGLSETDRSIFLDDIHYEEIPYLIVNSDDTIVDILPDTLEIDLQCNYNWSISKTGDWFTVYPMSGSGDQTSTFSNSTNSSGHERTDTVFVQNVFSDRDTIVITQLSPHFEPMWYGNPYNPMNIMIDSVIMNGEHLVAGDQIGIFDVDSVDNELCVGVGIVTDTVTAANPLVIVVALDDPTSDTVDGFKVGNEIIYKMWNANDSTECSQIFTDSIHCLAEYYKRNIPEGR